MNGKYNSKTSTGGSDEAHRPTMGKTEPQRQNNVLSNRKRVSLSDRKKSLRVAAKGVESMKSYIRFKGLVLEGRKHQKRLFKIFDLLDDMFTDEEKENMHFEWHDCEIRGFVIDGRKLKKGSTAWEFGKWLAEEIKSLKSFRRL